MTFVLINLTLVIFTQLFCFFRTTYRYVKKHDLVRTKKAIEVLGSTAICKRYAIEGTMKLP